MAAILGCIADDFTGATDIASILKRSGETVRLHIGTPKFSVSESATFEIIALKCRNLPVNDAVSECLRACEWLKNNGVKRFFWKYCSTFDSQIEGNIGPVSEALMAYLNVKQTIYCPAFPENNRKVFMGNLFVGQKLLSESSMKDHPLTPMRDSNLVRLLTPQVKTVVGLADHSIVIKGAIFLRKYLDELLESGVTHVIVDAISNDDLFTITKACSDFMLFTGGSALAMHLPNLFAKECDLIKQIPYPRSPHLYKESIILSGSCSEMTQRQVLSYMRTGAPSYKLNAIEIAEKGVDKVLEWLDDQSSLDIPLLYSTSTQKEVLKTQNILGVKKAAETIEFAMSKIATHARRMKKNKFIIAGGETAGAVLTALKINILDIGLEISPGVPWTFCENKGDPIALALKSGNFGAESFFKDSTNKLE